MAMQQTEFHRTGRLNISAGNEKELQQRIDDLEERGWVLKQIVPPEHKHFQDYSAGPKNNRKTVRSTPSFVKYRAVMIRGEVNAYQG